MFIGMSGFGVPWRRICAAASASPRTRWSARCAPGSPTSMRASTILARRPAETDEAERDILTDVAALFCLE